MEQRHREIRERAGREEARLNQEFIEFLKKWGTPILMVAAALSLGYVGLDYLKKQRAAKVDAAFKELQGVSLSGMLAASPDSLLNVASSYGDVTGVAYMARLGAGDSCLQAVRSGLRPGAVLKPDGTTEFPEDLLTDADRTAFLNQAASAYSEVLKLAEPHKGHEIHAIGALYGLAAVDEARGDTASAKAHLERVKVIAERAGFPMHVTLATNRIARLDSETGTPTLVSQSELPAPPPPPAEPAPVDGAAVTAGTDSGATTPGGETVPPTIPPAPSPTEPAADPKADPTPTPASPPTEPAPAPTEEPK